MAEFRNDTEVGICNQALSLAKSAATITSLDQKNSKAARACKRHYAVTRDRLLSDYRWNFNTKRDTFALDGTPPDYGYAYAYALPGDCLRVLEIEGCVGEEWTVEGRRLLIDRPAPLHGRYLRQVTEPKEYSAHFTELLFHELALLVASPLAHDNPTLNRIESRLETLRTRATRWDAREGREKWPDPEFEFISVRRI